MTILPRRKWYQVYLPEGGYGWASKAKTAEDYAEDRRLLALLGAAETQEETCEPS